MKVKRSPGFLLIYGLIILMIISTLVISMNQLIMTQTATQSNLTQYIQAQYIAEAGFQLERFNCNSSQALKSIPFGQGKFDVFCILEKANQAHMTSTGINNTQTLIKVDSTAGYSETGYLQIDNEILYYADRNPTTFLGITRGMMKTQPAPHLMTATLIQTQGLITSKAYLSNNIQYTLTRRIVIPQSPSTP